MHELAICQSLVDQARQVAAAHDAGGIERIVVRIGPLSGVEAPLLQAAFDIARQGAGLADAVLVIETSPLLVRCRTCGVESGVRVNALLCGACGDWRVDVISGDEMILKSLVLQDVAEPAKATG